MAATGLLLLLLEVKFLQRVHGRGERTALAAVGRDRRPHEEEMRDEVLCMVAVSCR